MLLLNNVGVVHQRAGRLSGAGLQFRRALREATTLLSAAGDHVISPAVADNAAENAVEHGSSRDANGRLDVQVCD